MRDIQKEVANWATYNFGANPIWQPTLGLFEETAEFCAAEESTQDPVRKQEGLAKMADALGDGAIFAMNICERSRLQFVDLYNHSFAEGLTDREMLGVLGLLSHTVLKHSQNIRGMDFNRMREHVGLAVAMWLRWAMFQADKLGRNLGVIIEEVWAEVSQRDWVKNPGIGQAPAPQEQPVVPAPEEQTP